MVKVRCSFVVDVDPTDYDIDDYSTKNFLQEVRNENWHHLLEFGETSDFKVELVDEGTL